MGTTKKVAPPKRRRKRCTVKNLNENIVLVKPDFDLTAADPTETPQWKRLAHASKRVVVRLVWFLLGDVDMF